MKALIIGGGIGGLAAAIGLSRIGYSVEVYERAQAIREVGAGLSLWPNALRALDILGVGDQIRPQAVPDISAGLRDRSGRILAGGSPEELARLVGGQTILLHRALLLDVLRTALGPEQLHTDALCTGFEEHTDGITATFADGRQATGDLLIGADGLRSVVRAVLHGNQPPQYAGYTAWRAVTAFDQQRLLPGESWGAGARFGHFPLKDGRVYWFATKTVPAGVHSPDGEQAELLRTFGDWHAPIADLISSSDPATILRNDIYDRPPLERWGSGRATLLGDAAHPMTPNLGQGACQALEDAVVLARCLAQANDVAAALRAYEAERAPRTAAVVKQSRQIGAIGQWHNPLAVRARDALMRVLPPSIRERQIAEVVAWS